MQRSDAPLTKKNLGQLPGSGGLNNP